MTDQYVIARFQVSGILECRIKKKREMNYQSITPIAGTPAQFSLRLSADLACCLYGIP